MRPNTFLVVAALTAACAEREPHYAPDAAGADLSAPSFDAVAGAPKNGDFAEGLWLVDMMPDDLQIGIAQGDPDWDTNHTVHMVTLTHEWSISETEVTNAQFQHYMDYDPQELWMMEGDVDYGYGCDDCPVQNVSWFEAAAYANAMSAEHGLDACYTCSGDDAEVMCEPAMDPYTCSGFRIPTEAEWEYAARGGEGFTYPGSDDIDEIGWWEDNSDDMLREVGTLKPNGYGLYDMGGNIREFVYDWLAPYPSEDQINPVVYPEAGTHPAERGGSWACRRPELRVDRRNLVMGFERDVHTGFRIARTADIPLK